MSKNKPASDVRVTVTVDVNGQTETFAAEAQSSTNGWRVADGLLLGLRSDAGQWLNDQSWTTSS